MSARPAGVGGTDYAVTSNNVTGTTAFNHLGNLNLSASDSATLVLPGATKALINLVDNKMLIDGTITTRLGSRTGAVGGTVYFLTQSGLLMGSTARINTGSLVVRGGVSTALPVNPFLGSGGQLVSGAAALAAGFGGSTSVTLGGVIAAPGGVDIKATTVTIAAGARVLAGAAALADLQAQTDDGGNALVSAAGLVAGTHLVAGADGAIRIAADGDLTMTDATNGTAAATLDARPVDYVDGVTTRTTPGGITLTSGGTLTVRGTLTAWDGIAANAGDVTLAASKTDKDAGLFSYAHASANSTLDVAGIVSGGTVRLTANANVSTDEKLTDLGLVALDGIVKLGSKVFAVVGASLSAYASIIDGASTVTIGSGSVVRARGDLTIAATTVAAGKAIARVRSDSNTGKVALAGAYSGLDASADVEINNAALTAGGALSLTATNDARSNVDVKAYSVGAAVAGAVAINEVTVDAKVGVGAGSSLTGGSVAVLSKNFQSDPSKGFFTAATALSTDGSAGGGAAAVLEQTIKATLNVAGTVTAKDSGSASFTSLSDTARNITGATSAADDSPLTMLQTMPSNTNELVGDVLGKIGSPIMAKIVMAIRGKAPKPADEPATINISAALALTESTQTATANVTASVTAGGAVTVAGTVRDGQARNNAGSSVSAKSGAGVTTAVAGAVAYDDTTYDAEATQTGDVTAGGLAVTSMVDRPLGENWLNDITAVDSDLNPIDYLGKLKDKLTAGLKIESGFFASSAGATANTLKADSTSISGSVSYNALTSTSHAAIGENAHLVLGDALAVRALTDIVALNIGGAIPGVQAILQRNSNNRAPGSAVGGAVAVFSADPTTIASIGDGVRVTRADQPGVTPAAAVGGVDATIEALATVKAVTLAPLSGSSGNGGFSGTFAVNLLDGQTHATVGAGSIFDLGTGAFKLNGHTALDIWGVAGSLAVAGGASSSTVGSVGISGVINKADFSTTAEFTPTAGAAKSLVTPGSVGIDAVTTGGVNALSVAGTAQNTAGGQPEPEDSSKGVKVKFYGGVLAGVAFDKLGDYLKTAAAAQDKAEKANKIKDGTSTTGKPATKSFGVAGSASVDLATLTTGIDVANAGFTRSGSVGTFRAVAAEGVDLLSLTGGAVLTYGPKPSDGSLQIAGAYGLASSSNSTAVGFAGSTITGFDGVNLEADANGLRIAAGLSLGVDASGADSGANIAASVSQIDDGDSASTIFTGGSIARGGAKSGTVSLLAYNSETLGAGAGGLSIGSTTGFGGAATVISAKPSGGAAIAKLTNASVTGFDSLSVRALNASLVASAAIAGAVSNGGSAGSVAINLNFIDMDTVAVVELGTGGKNSIDIGGALTIASGDVRTPETSATIDAGRTADTAGTTAKASYGLPANQFTDDANVGAPSSLNVGSRIYALALPIAVSTNGNAAGIAFSWNSIDNDRSAALTGGGLAGGAAVTAGSVAVNAVDLSKIVAVAAGVGAGKDSLGVMGSFARNSITGTTSATVDTDIGAARHLQIATGAFDIGAVADGGIWSLAGAIGASKGAAAGFALGINEVIRDTAAPLSPTPGLVAALTDITLSGTPTVTLHADSTGTIEATAVSGAGGSNTVVGAASLNTLKPDVTASASGLNYLNASTGDLKISAADTSTITSRALMLGIGSGNSAVAGVAVNDVAAHVAASLTAAEALNRIDVRNLVISAASVATTKTLGLGVAGSGGISVAGSVAVNTTNTTADALLTLSAGRVNAAGSVGVLATRDSTIDAFSGNVAVSTGGAAGGASVVVNDIGGGASAKIVGVVDSSARLTASADGALSDARQLKAVRTGATSAKQAASAGTPASLTDLKNIQNTAPTVDLVTADKQGVVVSASSTHGTRNFAVTGAVAADAALAATAVVTQAAGTTTAAIENTTVAVGKAGVTNDTLAVDVLAGTHIAGLSFAGAIAGAGGFAGAAPIVSDGYSATTDAHTTGSSLKSSGELAVLANASQSATALVVAGAIGGDGAAAVSTVSPRFTATTTALVDQPTALVAIGSGGVNIGAASQATATAIFGAIGISGGVALGGGIVVATNENTTTAKYVGLTDATSKLGTVKIDAPAVSVSAYGGYDATVWGGSLAVSDSAAGAANVIGVIQRGTVLASADALNYGIDDFAGNHGAVTIAATEDVKVRSKIVAVAVSGGGSVTVGAQFILAQGKVDAQLNRATVAADTVAVKATGTNYVDSVQAGFAAGAFGGGANVTYIGVGKVASDDTATLRASSTGDDADSKTAGLTGSTGSGNVNTAALSSGDLGGSKSVKAQSVLASTGVVSTTAGRRIATGATGTTAADGTTIASSTAGFGAVTSDPSDAADSRVRARITATGADGTTIVSGSLVAANAIAVTSDANLQSKSVNVQGTAGIAAASATVAITRNASNSFASLGDDVVVSGRAKAGDATKGSTLNVTASTGQQGGHAAEVNVYQGTAAGGAVSAAVADARLVSVTKAESSGKIDAFTTVKVAAADTSEVSATAIGVTVAAGVAVNIVAATADKKGTVLAGLSGTTTGTQVLAKAVDVTATAGGTTSATTIAGAGGGFFAGNAAVALATDERTVLAQVAENTRISTNALKVAATAIPDVYAQATGVTVSSGVAIGATVATATSAGTITATVGEGSTLTTGQYCTLAVCAPTVMVLASVAEPSSGLNVVAETTAAAGGALAAISGSVSTAILKATTTASLGADLDNVAGTALTFDAGTILTVDANNHPLLVVLPGAAVTVTASRDLAQSSSSSGLTVGGGLAVGAQYASADSSGDTSAKVLNVDGSDGLGAVSIVSDSHDQNTAVTKAGAGGLGAGVAAIATTSATGTAATIIEGAAGSVFKAASLEATAKAAAGYQTNSDSLLATAVGGSGTTSSNRIDTGAAVSLGRTLPNAAAGTNTRFEAGKFTVLANNIVDNANASAVGKGGGVLTGSAALVTTNITQHATSTVNDGVTLRQYGGDIGDNGRQTFIDATVSTQAHGEVQLVVGGIMSLPFAELNANYTPTAAVAIGKNVLLRGDQGIGVGTTIVEGTADTANVKVYGAAGAGGAATRANTTSTGLVSVGDGSTIESLADIRLSAGTSSRGTGSDILGLATQTEVFNWTAVPITIDADAYSTVRGTNTLTLGAATIRSGRDVIVTALAPTLGASAVGTGHDPYRELLSTTTNGSHLDQSGAGSIAFNGTQLTAGYLNTRTIDITGGTPGAFTVDIHESTADPDRLGKFTVAQNNLDVIANIDAKIAAFGIDPLHADDVAQLQETKAAILTGLAGATANINGVKVDGVFAGGGEVIIGTSKVNATGGARIDAKGAPTITITNTSANNLILGRLFVPFKPSGVISFTGPVDLAALKSEVGAGNVVTSGVDATAEGTIKAVSGQAFDTVLTDVITTGRIDNTGGVYKVVVNNGNYVQLSDVSAAVYSVSVPNGLFAVPTPSGTFDAGNPISFFYGHDGISLYSLDSSSTTANGSSGSFLGIPFRFELTATDAANYVATYLSNKSDPTLNFKHLEPQASGRALDLFATGPSKQDNTLVYDGHALDINGNRRTAYFAGYENLSSRDSIIWGSCADKSVCRAFSYYIGYGSAVLFTRDGQVDFHDSTGYGTVFYTPDIIWKDTVPNSPLTSIFPADYKGTKVATVLNTLDTSTSPAVTANQILIDAKFVNISADLVAGPSKQRTVTINASAPRVVTAYGIIDGTISFDNLLAGVTDGNGILLNKAYSAGLDQGIATTAQLAIGDIGARFHKATATDTAYIAIDPVAAGAGGYISITGRIVNTNPLTGDKGSHLIVKNGFADISIANNTGYDVRLNTLNAGSSADGVIKLVDHVINTDPSGSGYGTNFNTLTTIYRDTLGQPVTVDTTERRYFFGIGQSAYYYSPGTAHSVLAAGTGITGGAALDYAPLSQSVYYVYNESRNIHRSLLPIFVNGTDGVRNQEISSWTWADGGSRPQASAAGSGFLDLNGTANVDTTAAANSLQPTVAELKTAINADNRNFVQVVTGGLRTDVPNDLQSGAPGYTKQGLSGGRYDAAPHTWLVPTDATVNVLTAIRAGNPIGIMFQGSNGGITVASNAGGKIVLNGRLTDAGGKVTLLTSGAIEQSATGDVLARDLTLTSGASIGNGAGDPFRAAIVGRTSGTDGVGGTVSAVSANGDVSLRLTPTSGSGGALDSVRLDLVSAKGAVNIASDGGIAAVDHAGLANDANVIGQSVVLTAAGGVQGDPSFAAATALNRRGLSVDIRDAGSLTGTGTLTVAAGGDVDIRTATHGDGVGDIAATLRLANITTTGDVIVRASGSVVAADATTTIDQAKLDRFVAAAKALGVCSDGTCTNSTTIVSPGARAAIDADLRAGGAVAFDTYTIFSTTTGPTAIARANADAVGKLLAADAFKAEAAVAGVTIGSDGRVTVAALLATTDPLYTAALHALEGKRDLVRALAPYSASYAAQLATVTAEVVPLPNVSDLQRGLQLYYDTLRLPLAALFTGTSAPTLGMAATPAQQQAVDAANLKTVGSAVTATGYATYGAAQVAGAKLTLTDLFGKVPTEAAFVQTATIVGFDRYLVGATWSQTMLDFSVPSSAFVPVADTQFQTRTPVITARNVFITAGDSIGSFDAAQTFTFDKTGVDQAVGASTADKAARTQLAAAYLASAGPGDLTTVLKDSNGAVITDPTKATIASVGFTTRRDQPLQLAATGTVNALAATRLVATAGYATTTATTEARAVRGDIFINNTGALTIGDIISEKVVANPVTTHLVGSTVTNDCATGIASPADCDSRIRLVAERITGVNGGAPVIGGRRRNAFFTSPNLSDGAGRAVIMGGLVRLEASSGSIGLAAPTVASGSGLLIDARAIETVRAAGDISLVKRAPVAVGIFTGPYGIFEPTTDTAYPADLIVGDVFAGGRFTLDNPIGSLYVGALPSNLSTENRNARLVAQTLALRAYGDIGNTALTTAAKPGLFDITAPVIDVLLAGYDFATAKLRTIASAPSDPTGSVSFGLRGNTLVGGSPTSRLGARRSITIGNIDDFPSNIDIETSIEVGEKVTITTAGGVTFGRLVNIGVLADGNQTPGVLDLSGLTLNLLGPLNLTDTRSLIFGSLSANGGTVESDGFITLRGTLTGTGNDPFTLYGHQGVTVGGLAGGAVGLRSDLDVTLTGPAFVRNLTLQGRSVTTDGVIGTTVTLVAADTGTVTIGGTTRLTRDSGAPGTPANLTATGGNVALTGPLDVADAVVLTATGTVPNGVLTLGGPVSGTDVTLTAPTFVGGNSDVTARGSLLLTTTTDVALGRLTAKSGSVTTAGALTTVGGVTVTDGALSLTARDIDLGASDSIKGALTVTASGDIRLGKSVGVTNSTTGGEALTLTAASRIVAPAGAVISGETTAAALTITTGNVDFDPTVSVTGFNVIVRATGKATVGSILAGSNQSVAVTARSAVTTGAVTGQTITLFSSTDALNILGPITGGVVALTADRAIVTNGLTATAATVTSTLGGINLNGATTIANAAAPTTARLSATAAQTIMINGRARATGGMTLTATTLLTSTTGGVLVDTGLFGAPFTLRANTVNVSFDTGALAGADLHVDARSRSGGLLALGEFHFAGIRGVTFDTLSAAKARIYANQLLTITSLSMTDYLWFNIGGQTLALTGTGAGVPTAQRKVATGALKTVKVVVTPTRAAPTLTVNGVGR